MIQFLAVLAGPVGWAAAGIVTAVGGGIALYKWLSKADKIILLRGSEGAGKDTLLHILEGKGYTSIDKPTQQAHSNDPIEIKIDGTKYAIYNTAGANFAKEELENFRNEVIKHEKPVLEILVFDARKYDSEKAKIQAYRIEAKERGFHSLVIGTRAGELSAEKLNEIKNEIKDEIGLRVAILELSKNPVDELETLIKASV